jgi:hypothetical protein
VENNSEAFCVFFRSATSNKSETVGGVTEHQRFNCKIAGPTGATIAEEIAP